MPGVGGRYLHLWEPSLDIGVETSPPSLVFFSFLFIVLFFRLLCSHVSFVVTISSFTTTTTTVQANSLVQNFADYSNLADPLLLLPSILYKLQLLYLSGLLFD